MRVFGREYAVWVERKALQTKISREKMGPNTSIILPNKENPEDQIQGTGSTVSGREYTILAEAGERGKEWEGGRGGGVRDSARGRSAWGKRREYLFAREMQVQTSFLMLAVCPKIQPF